MTQAIFDPDRNGPLFLSLPQPLSTLGTAIFPYVNVLNNLSRRINHPYLFATGAALHEIFPNAKLLSITSSVVALATRLLAVHASFKDLSDSALRIRSIRILPSPPALSYLLLSADSFDNKDSLFLPTTFYAFIRTFLHQCNEWIEHLKDLSWKLLHLIFRVYSLVTFFFWTKEDMKEATQELFINLRECADYISETQNTCEPIERAIETHLSDFFSLLGIGKDCESLFTTTRQTLPLLQVIR